MPSIKRSDRDSKTSALIICIHSKKICTCRKNKKNVTHVHGTHEYVHTQKDCMFTGWVKPSPLQTLWYLEVMSGKFLLCVCMYKQISAFIILLNKYV